MTSTAQTPSGVARARRAAPLIDRWGLLILPLLAFLVIGFLAPIAIMLSRSLTDPQFGLQNFQAMFEGALYVKVLRNTFVTAILVTLITLCLAFPYAYLMTIAPAFWRGVLLISVLIPFWTGMLVRTFALMLLLRDSGPLNKALESSGLIDSPVPMIRNEFGVLFGMVQVALPFAVLPIYATMRTIDRRLVLAAQGLGARPSGAFWRVFAPLTLPGVAAAMLLVFIQALGYYITPAMLGGQQNTMIGELIVQQISEVLNFGLAAALATLLLLVTLLLLAIGARFLDLQKFMMGGDR